MKASDIMMSFEEPGGTYANIIRDEIVGVHTLYPPCDGDPDGVAAIVTCGGAAIAVKGPADSVIKKIQDSIISDQ